MNPDPEFTVNLDPNLIRIQGFDDQNVDKKKSADIFIDQILQFTYPKASIKDIQATGEAFSPKKENVQHCKKRKLLTFFYVCGTFCPPVSGSGLRIRIHNTVF
jgi:hypothetical protein